MARTPYSQVANQYGDVVATLAGEVGFTNGQLNVDDVIAAAHTIKNRSEHYGVTPQEVVSLVSQYNAYGKSIPAGNANFAAQIQQIVEAVFSGQIPDPTFGATYYATPAALGDLPAGIGRQRPTYKSGHHHYFRDEQNRPIKTAAGTKRWIPDLPQPRPSTPAYQLEDFDTQGFINRVQKAVDRQQLNERAGLGGPFNPVGGLAYETSGINPIRDVLASLPRSRPTPPDAVYGSAPMPRERPNFGIDIDTSRPVHNIDGMPATERSETRQVPSGQWINNTTVGPYSVTGVFDTLPQAIDAARLRSDVVTQARPDIGMPMPRSRPSDHMRAGVGIPPYGFEDRIANALSVNSSWDRNSVPMPRSRPTLGPGPAEPASETISTFGGASRLQRGGDPYAEGATLGRSFDPAQAPIAAPEDIQSYGDWPDPVAAPAATPPDLDYDLGYNIGDDYVAPPEDYIAGTPEDVHKQMMMAAGVIPTPEVLGPMDIAGPVVPAPLPQARPPTPVNLLQQGTVPPVGQPLNLLQQGPLPGLQTAGGGLGGIAGTGVSLFSPDTFVTNTISNVLRAGGSGSQAMSAARQARTIAQPRLYGGSDSGSARVARAMNDYADAGLTGTRSRNTGLGSGDYGGNAGHSMGWG
jgi:hypothetical protein